MGHTSHFTMYVKAFLASLLVLGLVSFATSLDDLKIEVLDKPEENSEFCKRKSKNGDTVEVHYVGKLENGNEFDNSFKRGQPLSFTLGQGMVISGWEKGLLGMCRGEKRKLTIPPHMGYGERGFPPVIPA